MALSIAEKRAMIAATYEAAKAMVDDLDHIREVAAKPIPSTGDIRRMSNLLRRLLISYGGDLRRIAPPRLDRRLTLFAPDVDANSRKQQPWYFGSLGTEGMLGLQGGQFVIADPTTKTVNPIISPPYVQSPELEYTLYGERIDENQNKPLIALPAHHFLSQRVLYFSRKWITRSDAITYVANIAGGVHSGDPSEDPKKRHIFERLHQIRQLCTLRVQDGQPQWRIYQRSTS